MNQSRGTRKEGRRSAELDYIVADSNVAWKWGFAVMWTNESDHAWLASRAQPHRAGGRTCTPANLNSLPREAFYGPEDSVQNNGYTARGGGAAGAERFMDS